MKLFKHKKALSLSGRALLNTSTIMTSRYKHTLPVAGTTAHKRATAAVSERLMDHWISHVEIDKYFLETANL
jgi:hypothetical protein